ncbi:pre-mRNA-splicing factor CWC22 homolog [Brassica napus]|uniref:pre-mRNA-splicing factor CWC22 homolog n=1 Tax=Brassica napus TaxID=3708 RepID=UPI00207A8B00|nr:pre-mRNA-splicing factor CWC22 homolog [Brassica napus]
MEGEGVYVPAFRRKEKTIDAERESWDELKRRINALVNKVSVHNLRHVVLELFEEDLIRGRGLLCRSCMKSQIASPSFTDVIAALIAVVNSKLPSIGDLLLKRLVLQIRRAYERSDKPLLLAVVKFLAHLVNQRVACEIIALEVIHMLLRKPTEDTLEVAVVFVRECGALLLDLSPRRFDVIFDVFRRVVQEGDLEFRSRCLIESLVALRRSNFEGYPAVRDELDLVDSDEKVMHVISLYDESDPETSLDVYKADPEFHHNEKKYELLKRNILGEQEDDDDDDERTLIQDHTETDLVSLRRTIYQTIMSTLNFEEAGHKLLQIRLEPGQEMELCVMILECCAEEKTYRPFYGHLAQRFCLRSKTYRECFEDLFVRQYATVHRLETNKPKNVAIFFAHVLATDALPWRVLANVSLTEEDTTSSSRIFLKILFQELCEQMGMRALNEKLQDPTMEETFESIFPKDHPKNMRFSINFFTSIGLGDITEKLRQLLIN